MSERAPTETTTLDRYGFAELPWSRPRALLSAGPPPWHLWRFQFHTVFGVATAEPFGATRWRFEA